MINRELPRDARAETESEISGVAHVSHVNTIARRMRQRAQRRCASPASIELCATDVTKCHCQRTEGSD